MKKLYITASLIALALTVSAQNKPKADTSKVKYDTIVVSTKASYLKLIDDLNKLEKDLAGVKGYQFADQVNKAVGAFGAAVQVIIQPVQMAPTAAKVTETDKKKKKQP